MNITIDGILDSCIFDTGKIFIHTPKTNVNDGEVAIKTFYIKNFNITGFYTNIELQNSGLDSLNNIFSKTITNCDVNENSVYYLSLASSSDAVFKVASITENYINEYLITATEYDICKYNYIENTNTNYSCDLKLSDNGYCFNTCKSNSLDAPFISSLLYKESSIKNNFFEIQWTPVNCADGYLIYLEKPSNYLFYICKDIEALNNYYLRDNSYILNIDITSKQVGTYNFSISAYSKQNNSICKLSNQTKRSINVICIN